MILQGLQGPQLVPLLVTWSLFWVCPQVWNPPGLSVPYIWAQSLQQLLGENLRSESSLFSNEHRLSWVAYFYTLLPGYACPAEAEGDGILSLQCIIIPL